MVNAYCEGLYRELEEKLSEIQRSILSGNPKSFEHFKQLLGRAEGLEVAISIAKGLYKKMYETKNLDENKEVNHDERRVVRELY